MKAIAFARPYIIHPTIHLSLWTVISILQSELGVQVVDASCELRIASFEIRVFGLRKVKVAAFGAVAACPCQLPLLLLLLLSSLSPPLWVFVFVFIIIFMFWLRSIAVRANVWVQKKEVAKIQKLRKFTAKAAKLCKIITTSSSSASRIRVRLRTCVCAR